MIARTQILFTNFANTGSGRILYDHVALFLGVTSWANVFGQGSAADCYGPLSAPRIIGLTIMREGLNVDDQPWTPFLASHAKNSYG